MHLTSSDLKRQFENEVLHEVPGREEEAQEIFKFICDGENGTSAPLILGGNTGCGKTSLMRALMAFMMRVESVSVAYVNCMDISMDKPNRVYCSLIEQLFGKEEVVRSKPDEALRSKMEDGKNTYFMVLDEVDKFLHHKNFLYIILEWLAEEKIKLVMVWISNKIDLVSSLKDKQQKISSRVKSSSVLFKPYIADHIHKIIEEKFPSLLKLVDEKCIFAISRLVASNHNSDIRELAKINTKIATEYERRRRKDKFSLEDIWDLVSRGQEETVSVTHNYRDLIEVLAACSVNNNSGPVDISEHIKAKFYLSNRHRSIRSQDIVAMLCDLQDMGLISLTRYSSNCQLSFQKHGIRLNETADQLKRLK